MVPDCVAAEWYCHAIRGHNHFLNLTRQRQKKLGQKNAALGICTSLLRETFMKIITPWLIIFVVALVASLALSADRGDIVIADFEGDDFGAWKVEGSAFGTKPARGALPGQ